MIATAFCMAMALAQSPEVVGVPEGPAKAVLLQPFPFRLADGNPRTLRKTLELAREKYGIPIELDEKAFRDAGVKAPLDERFGNWSTIHRTDVTLRLFLDQCCLDAVVEKDRIRVVPLGRGQPFVFPPDDDDKKRAKAAREWVKTPFTNEREIDQVPLGSLLDFMGLKARGELTPGVNIPAFQRVFPDRIFVLDQRVNLTTYDRQPLRDVLDDVTAQIDGTWFVTDYGYIEIRPIEKK